MNILCSHEEIKAKISCFNYNTSLTCHKLSRQMKLIKIIINVKCIRNTATGSQKWQQMDLSV